MISFMIVREQPFAWLPSSTRARHGLGAGAEGIYT
jgi:hypothetical protein